MPTTVYLAIDPGETTGYAGFDKNGKVTMMGQFLQKHQAKELDRLVKDTLKAVIIEDYRNYWKQQRWSRNQTSKNIGAIEMICELRDVPYFTQPANVKPIGYRYLGLEGPPSNHAISHEWDALAHGKYWLVTKKISQPDIPKE